MNVSAPQTHGLAFFSDKEKEKGVWFFLFLFFCKQKKALQFGKMKEAVVSPPPSSPSSQCAKWGTTKTLKLLEILERATRMDRVLVFLFFSPRDPLEPSPSPPPLTIHPFSLLFSGVFLVEISNEMAPQSLRVSLQGPPQKNQYNPVVRSSKTR